jgi:hypothetical protein
MALGSTQSLTEMSTRNLPGGKGRPAFKADNLTAIREPIVQKMWEPRRLTTLWASLACYRSTSLFYYCYINFGRSVTVLNLTDNKILKRSALLDMSQIRRKDKEIVIGDKGL